MKNTNYEQQANDFLSKTNTTIQIEWLKYGKHFLKETQNRHIFKIIIKRGKKQFSLNYGQSLYEGANEPTNYDILSCLRNYEVGTFENFCSEFDYDFEDSRTAEKIYKAVSKEYNNVCKIWNDSEIKELQEIN